MGPGDARATPGPDAKPAMRLMKFNLRHLRVCAAVAAHASITRAAEDCGLSQPAVTQAIGKIESDLGETLFDRGTKGVAPNGVGRLFAERIERALGLLDAAFETVAPRLRLTATTSQLVALVAVREASSFTRAAQQLGVAQPTVHRAVSQLEEEAVRPLFERTVHGVHATRAGHALANAAQLAFAELAQARMEVAEIGGREAGRIVVGAMPLSRSFRLPAAVARFRERWPRMPLRVVDGPYAELVRGLRRGEIDFLIGALREPHLVEDIEQSELFEDNLVIVARPGHPLLSKQTIAVEDLCRFPWIVARAGTPTRTHFDRLVTAFSSAPLSVVESGSLIFMRELVTGSDHLGCVSRLQAEAEVSKGRLAVVPFAMEGTLRPIGITVRRGWRPTKSQAALLEELRRGDRGSLAAGKARPRGAPAVAP